MKAVENIPLTFVLPLLRARGKAGLALVDKNISEIPRDFSKESIDVAE